MTLNTVTGDGTVKEIISSANFQIDNMVSFKTGVASEACLLYTSSMPGIVSGIVVGIVTVLLAAGAPAKRAAKVSPVTAVSGNSQNDGNAHHTVNTPVSYTHLAWR